MSVIKNSIAFCIVVGFLTVLGWTTWFISTMPREVQVLLLAQVMSIVERLGHTAVSRIVCASV